MAEKKPNQTNEDDPNAEIRARQDQLEQAILSLRDDMEKLKSPAAREKMEERIAVLEKELTALRSKPEPKPDDKQPEPKKDDPKPTPKKCFFDED